ncbi:GSCOCG00012760001-RA-CDS, partial [Cotesia congregata]
VPNEFPIKRDGILGSKFLEDNFADVCHSQKCLKLKDKLIKFEHEETISVPPRSRTGFYVRVANPEVKTGYVKQLNISKGIYLGEALVTNRDGKAYMIAINTTQKRVEIVVPVVKLEPYKE